MNNINGNTTARINKKYKKKSRIHEIWKRMKKNKTAVAGMIIFIVIMFCTFFANFIVPYDMVLEQNIGVRLQPPSTEHLFGTDLFGRDIFARIIYGSRNSILMGMGAVAVGITIGGIFGAISGYYGGLVDTIIMRIMDTFICIPFILMALAIVAALGPGFVNVLIAMMVTNIPSYTRIIRSVILTIVGQDFIEAAKSCGAPNYMIILKHILPNAIGVVIVQATMSVGGMIILAASMSFLGMGIQPPTPEWGSMLSEGKDYMMYAPHLVAFPGLAIAITTLSLNLMGDGLRDALDPRLK